jgi:hypothetical protein
MIVKETTDLGDIKAILCNPAIYDTITEDNSPLAEGFTPVFEEHLYIGGYVKGEIIALMVYHKYLDGNKCHVQVLPEFRKEYALKFGLKSLLFRGSLPLYAVIPDLYKNVLEFSFLFGFEVIKTTENTYIKNGQSYDDNILRLK